MSIKFAPDTATADRAQQLSKTKFWRSLARNSSVIWGECKSSGLTYSKVAFALKTQTFLCNCASRKYPCKHALALSILQTTQPEALLVQEEIPDWVVDWMTKGLSTEWSETSETEKSKAENRQKNFSKRLQQMLAGLDELENWLQDVLRQGTASLVAQPINYWYDIAARLYDAKLSAIGHRIRNLPTIINENEEWPTYLLGELSAYYLLLRGLRKMEELPLNIQQDLLTYAGVTTRKDALFQYGQPIKDTWMVLGVKEEVEEKLTARKTWLLGFETKRYGLVLDFTFGNQPFATNYRAGNVFVGQAVFYPSNAPLRLAIKEKSLLDRRVKRIVGFGSLSEYLNFYAQYLAANPLQFSLPCSIEQVRPSLQGEILQLIDQENKIIPISVSLLQKWKIVAISGGSPVQIFGEWTGKELLPLSISSNNQFFHLS